MKSLITVFLLVFAFSRCDAQPEPISSEGLQETLNLAYLSPEDTETDSLQRLNLVLPQNVEKPPLLLWIGGGAWSFVNRHQEMDLARQFACKGIAVASVGHRLSKGAFANAGRDYGVKHPAHIKDIAAAFSWLKEKASEYGYNGERIFVGGFSSGAHLAALLASDKQYLQEHDLELTDIRGIIPVAGAYDIADYYSVFANNDDPDTRLMADTHVKDVFGEEKDFKGASPSAYIDNLTIPMLLISEGALFNYTKLYEEKLWESDYRQCQILHVFDKDHGGLWRDISHGENSFTRNVIVDFILRNG